MTTTTPIYSVIIPAYNEEALLPESLDRLTAAMQQVPCPGEIIVVDNNSTDRTAAVATEHEATVVFEEHRQISRARNHGAAAARGQYLIFIDADTVVSPELLQLTLKELSSGFCCGGGARVQFGGRPPLSARMMMALWNVSARFHRCAAGCYLFAERAAFRTAGGFSEKFYAGEELDLSRKIRRAGKARRLHFTIITEAAVQTSPRKVHAHSALKIMGLFLLFACCPFLLRSRKACAFWYNCRNNSISAK